MKMRMYLFENVKKCRKGYHKKGSVIVIAKDFEQMKKMVEREKDLEITQAEHGKRINYILMYGEPKIYILPKD
jgi:hypothetical protein